MASQTNSLVSQDSPALNSLLSSLHTDLGVVGQHQDDLAEGVSYLGSALKGFQSIAYSGSTPVSWGNIFLNPASLTQTLGIIGPCGTLDQVLNQVLGPDPSGVRPADGAVARHRVQPGAGRWAERPERVAHDDAGHRCGHLQLDQAVVVLGRRRAQLRPRRPVPAPQPVAAGDEVMDFLRRIRTSKVFTLRRGGGRHRGRRARRRPGHQGQADLSDQRRVLERARSLHRRRGRRARGEGRVGDQRGERGQHGARHARGEPGHQGPGLRVRVARRAPAARFTRRRPQPRLHGRPVPGAERDHRREPHRGARLDGRGAEGIAALAQRAEPARRGEPGVQPGHRPRRPGPEPQQAHRVGRGHRAAPGGEGQRPGPAQRHAGPADRDARYGHLTDRAADRAVRHGVDDGGAALGAAERRHHPAVAGERRPRAAAGAEPPAPRGRRGHGHDGRADAGPQPRQRRRDPPERQQPLPRGPARLRPQLQLARPQPRRPRPA